ncbi:Mitochondrial inner membrane protein oxa1 [Orbilia blumenaviensis]|uniref:Mitochondrial inner membrane protein oxa1 n=1 Tax=Orbilia blumenaviensis TaxID=1796055 RepID=A0AAV9V1J2_9PEZI
MLSRVVRRPLSAKLPRPSIRVDSGLLSSPRQFSQLSSASHPTSRWAPSRPTSLTSRSSIALKASTIPSIRFASTGAAAPSTGTPPPPDIDLSNFTQEVETHSTSFVDRFLPAVPNAHGVTDHPPDTMGYLHALGLDNGWGPTTIMQNAFEALHVATGAPWWATAVMATIAMRILFVPLFVRVSDNTARMKELQPLLLPYMERQRIAIKNQDLQAQQQIRTEIMALYKRSGVSPFRSLTTIFQIPFQFGSFMILRQMAYLPVPGLENSGVLWFQDLTSADPFFILPITSSFFLYLSMRLGAIDMPTQHGPMMKYVRIGLPLLSLGITCTMPSILTLYFLTTSVVSFIQAAIMRNEKVRAWLGIYPLRREVLAKPLDSSNLSAEALARIKADETIVQTEKDRRMRESRGGMLATAMGTKGGLIDGVKEQMRNSTEEKRHKEYEKRAKEEDEFRKLMGRGRR